MNSVVFYFHVNLGDYRKRRTGLSSYVSPPLVETMETSCLGAGAGGEAWRDGETRPTAS